LPRTQTENAITGVPNGYTDVDETMFTNITKNIPEWNLGSDVALTDETEDNVE
jgi:hypothetical protein